MLARQHLAFALAVERFYRITVEAYPPTRRRRFAIALDRSHAEPAHYCIFRNRQIRGGLFGSHSRAALLHMSPFRVALRIMRNLYHQCHSRQVTIALAAYLRGMGSETERLPTDYALPSREIGHRGSRVAVGIAPLGTRRIAIALSCLGMLNAREIEYTSQLCPTHIRMAAQPYFKIGLGGQITLTRHSPVD
jgi:hypothetical protein